ncbi:hypothetical protein E3J68_00130 [Candidatus Aerophobetes bacterium]|uniref:Uncharacterized protein n=1 Tax=Aerophobetes bacterium TaxID=2030807 RepID=A0A523TKS7_UNCAE|nr:MAG: hypothetical protein E3J68_00130 [Candidatus Aerophobetes bacterium]
MVKQLHKRFSTQEVKMLLQKYLEDKKKLPHVLQILKIKRRKFFKLPQLLSFKRLITSCIFSSA